MKSIRVYSGVVLLLGVGIIACQLPQTANAEGRCPPGQYPIGGQGVGGCAPIPGGTTGAGQASPVATGRWIKTWGAIALAKGGDVGVALGKRKKRDAASESLANCAQRGATDCRVVLEFNNQCAAFVSPSDARFGGSTFARAASVDAASKMAVDACLKQGSDGCKVIYSGCTEPEFENF